MACCGCFTEKQLVLIKTALHLAKDKLDWTEVDVTIDDINILLQLEAERRRERRKSLRIERKAAGRKS